MILGQFPHFIIKLNFSEVKFLQFSYVKKYQQLKLPFTIMLDRYDWVCSESRGNFSPLKHVGCGRRDWILTFIFTILPFSHPSEKVSARRFNLCELKNKPQYTINWEKGVVNPT